MKLQTITLNLNGKTARDLELALQEAISRIEAGSSSGSDKNDTGGFSFDVKSEVEPIDISDITAEAEYIAAQLISGGELVVSGLGQLLIGFAVSSEGLDMDEFNEHIEGNIASMIQVMIDEGGGVDNDGDGDLVSALNDFFEFDNPIAALSDAPTVVAA